MTPAINLLKKRKIPHTIHEYDHDPQSSSYGLEAAEKMGVPQEQVFKTLVVQLNGQDCGVAIIPVAEKLSMKLCAKAFGAKKATMAQGDDVERLTGYVLGGVSPLGQKKRLKTVLDSSVEHHTTIFVSGGRRGLDIGLNPTDLARLTGGTTSPLCG